MKINKLFPGKTQKVIENEKESQDPRQHFMGYSPTHTTSFYQVKWESIQCFLCNVVHKQTHIHEWTGVKT